MSKAKKYLMVGFSEDGIWFGNTSKEEIEKRANDRDEKITFLDYIPMVSDGCFCTKGGGYDPDTSKVFVISYEGPIVPKAKIKATKWEIE